MSCQDRLQQAWQSQPCGKLQINPDQLPGPNQLLKTARFERRVYFWRDVFIVSVFICIGVLMAKSAFRDIQKYWPWLISTASDAWVVGYILFNHWRGRRDATHYDETMLAHIERSIKETEDRIRQDRYSLWWYVLPVALGCMIPPIFFCAMEYSKKPEGILLFQLLLVLGTLAATFIFAHLVMKHAGSMGHEARHRELLALRTLRETLLNEGAGDWDGRP